MTKQTKKRSYQKKLFLIQDKLNSLSLKNKILLLVAIIGMLIGSIGMFNTLLTKHSITVPTIGGTVAEGVVGVPRFINPILADSLADKDVTTLIFSGLMQRSPDGKISPDLAQDYSISQDQKTYIFYLREDIKFHDGKNITAQDVAFTINQTQVSSLQSPQRESWQGVKTTILDSRTIQFDLPQPYAGFLNQTTIGIIPKHLWDGIPSEQFAFSTLNSFPVGSGPFAIKSIKRSRQNGIPTAYVLKPNNQYWSGRPNINKVIFKFYANENDLIKAFQKGDIDNMAAISPKLINNFDYEMLVSTPLPRVFGIFFNKNRNPILQDKNLLDIINRSLDKKFMVDNVLNTFGSPLNGPLPPTLSTLDENEFYSVNREVLKTELDNLGWTVSDSSSGIRQKNGEVLKFSLATSDLPELIETANEIKKTLDEIGILVTINVFEVRNLELAIIQTRNFEALLFGQVIRHDTDLYAFWHSSQSGLNGLNITNYENPEVDEALALSLASKDIGLRQNIYRTVEEKINEDKPAVFLYAPHLVYVTRKKIYNFDIGKVTEPSDRLIQAKDWYVTTERIWKFLYN